MNCFLCNAKPKAYAAGDRLQELAEDTLGLPYIGKSFCPQGRTRRENVKRSPAALSAHSV